MDVTLFTSTLLMLLTAFCMCHLRCELFFFYPELTDWLGGIYSHYIKGLTLLNKSAAAGPQLCYGRREERNLLFQALLFRQCRLRMRTVA